jgi:deoxyribose-phosphate aldolase
MFEASWVDYTMLSAAPSLAAIREHCQTAAQKGYGTVCIPPYFVKTALEVLGSEGPRICTVIGFPMGYEPVLSKTTAIELGAHDGASEFDCVWNRGAFLNDDDHHIREELVQLRRVTQDSGALLKIIIEAGQLDQEELKQACSLCAEAGVDYVKTATGFFEPGADVEIVRQMYNWLPDAVKIKASGGIRTREDAEALIAAGASRIGTSTVL